MAVNNRNFVIFVALIQIALLGLVILSAQGVNVPVIRQVLGFAYLLLIPGIAILRIFNVKNSSLTRYLLLAIGLSIFFLMAIGLLTNEICLRFNIIDPIGVRNLLISVMGTTSILSLISYFTHNDMDTETICSFDWKSIVSPNVLFLALIPLIAILGALINNDYQNNSLLLVLIVLIAMVPLLAVKTRFIPKNLYPWAIFVISLGILFHYSLIGKYINSFDIHTEYYLANLVVQNSFWNSTIPQLYNSTISVTILAPLLDKILSLDLTWIFKVVYPLLYALVPVIIFEAVKKQTGNKIAFLATFFFISISTFYFDMPGTAREEIASIFFALLILILANKVVNQQFNRILICVFSIALVMSHYTMAFILIGLLIFSLLILTFISRFKNGKFKHNQINTIEPVFIYLLIVCFAGWYIFTSEAFTFSQLVQVGKDIVVNLTNLVNVNTSEPLNIITSSTVSPLHEVLKYLLLLTQFLIGVGILDMIFHWTKKKFTNEYALLESRQLYIIGCCYCRAIPSNIYSNY